MIRSRIRSTPHTFIQHTHVQQVYSHSRLAQRRKHGLCETAATRALIGPLNDKHLAPAEFHRAESRRQNPFSTAFAWRARAREKSSGTALSAPRSAPPAAPPAPSPAPLSATPPAPPAPPLAPPPAPLPASPPAPQRGLRRHFLVAGVAWALALPRGVDAQRSAQGGASRSRATLLSRHYYYYYYITYYTYTITITITILYDPRHQEAAGGESDEEDSPLSIFRDLRRGLHPVSVRRFPSFRTQPLENLSVDSVSNGFLSKPAPGENLLSGNLVMETGCAFHRGRSRNTRCCLKQHGTQHYCNTDTTCNHIFSETTPFETTPYAGRKSCFEQPKAYGPGLPEAGSLSQNICGV